jgi:hypothetical protein
MDCEYIRNQPRENISQDSVIVSSKGFQENTQAVYLKEPCLKAHDLRSNFLYTSKLSDIKMYFV